MKFEDFGLAPSLLDSIESMGYEDATPIQEQAIPVILENKDLIACAQTGTGKTGAYLIPTIQHLMEEESDQTRVIIVVPTRELANQIDHNVEALSYFTGVTSAAVIGGNNPKDWERQKYAITNGADIIIATPGRLLMHLSMGYTELSSVKRVILDEADRMLDMGFHHDILRIMEYLPGREQTLMFSATMPKKIRDLARKILKEQVEIDLNLSKPAEGVNQLAFHVYDEQKFKALEYLIDTREVESMIIFASSKASVDKITRILDRSNYEARAIHSDKEQHEREAALRDFKNRSFRILVGTDVIARGIDIDNLSHVVNFDVPGDAEDYVHRVGRTARAQTTGEAITFVNPKDQYKFNRIEEMIESRVPAGELPEEFGERPQYSPKNFSRSGRGGNRRGGKGRNNHRRGSGSHQKGRHSGGQQRKSGSRSRKPQKRNGNSNNDS